MRTNIVCALGLAAAALACGEPPGSSLENLEDLDGEATPDEAPSIGMPPVSFKAAPLDFRQLYVLILQVTRRPAAYPAGLPHTTIQVAASTEAPPAPFSFTEGCTTDVLDVAPWRAVPGGVLRNTGRTFELAQRPHDNTAVMELSLPGGTAWGERTGWLPAGKPFVLLQDGQILAKDLVGVPPVHLVTKLPRTMPAELRWEPGGGDYIQIWPMYRLTEADPAFDYVLRCKVKDDGAFTFAPTDLARSNGRPVPPLDYVDLYRVKVVTEGSLVFQSVSVARFAAGQE